MLSLRHAEMVRCLRDGDRFNYRTFFRRVRKEGQRAEVRRDELAGCLRTIEGGSGRQFLLMAGRGEVFMRAMTVREYARLQGIPDHAAFKGRERFLLSCLGDAVCVPAVGWIGNALRY